MAGQAKAPIGPARRARVGWLRLIHGCSLADESTINPGPEPVSIALSFMGLFKTFTK
jgi:hypothetical protein